MAQNQCPNCGSYDTQRIRSPFPFWLAVLCGIGGFGLGLIITIPIWLIVRIAIIGKERYRFGHQCNTCKYEWLQRPGEVLPVTVRPDLIKEGRKRQEEEARQAAMYYYQQQHYRDE
jgi:hypothetical protein